jgi:PST family polysaccharide transporter
MSMTGPANGADHGSETPTAIIPTDDFPTMLLERAALEQALAAEPSDQTPELSSRRMGKAALWSAANSFLLRLGQLGVGVVSARLIAPDQFGVFAVALTVQAVIVNVSELGVSAALVRAKENVDQVARVVALISILSSAALNALMFLLAPQLASLLGEPAAANVIRILSFTVLLGGISAVPYAMLVREFRQDKRFLADGLNFVVSSATIVLLALNGSGADALATSRVLGMIATVIVLFVIVTPRYLPGYDRDEVRRVLRFSLPLAGADVVGFGLSNADYVVVARMEGALPLGFYQLAYNVSGWPVSVLGLVVNEVALPAFAHARHQTAQLPRRAADALALTGAIALPISAIIFVLARPLVEVLYGSRWSGATSALALLGVFGAVRILLVLINNMQAALGRTRGVLGVQITWLVALVPALIIGVNLDGIRGAALAQEVVGVGIVLPLALVLVSRAGCGPILTLARSLVLPLAGAVLAGLVAWGVADVLGPNWQKLIAGGLAGAVVYVLVFGLWIRRLIRSSARQWDDQGQPPDSDADRAGGQHRVPGVDGKRRTSNRAGIGSKEGSDVESAD